MNETNTQENLSLPTLPPKKKKHILPKILLTLLILLVIVAVFLYGILIGGKYGGKIGDIDPDKFPVTEYIVTALRDIGKIDCSITLSEEHLNSLLVQYEDNFKPLKNIYAAPKDGYIVFSGQVTAESLSEAGTLNIPDILWLFLPSVLNIKAEVALLVENGEPKLNINSVSILNAENDKELISLSGFEGLLQGLIDDVLKNTLPETITFKEITVTEEGINIKGTVAILTNE